MHIPPRFQTFIDDDYEYEQRLRKGRQSAYRSANPTLRKSARQAQHAEEGKLQRAAKSHKVTVRTDESLDKLRELGYEHYRFRTHLQGREIAGMGHMHPDNLDRLTVNFIRHSRTEYDHSLAQSRSSAGKRHGAMSAEIKVACLEEIADMFPELADECERQMITSINSLELSSHHVKGLQLAA